MAFGLFGCPRQLFHFFCSPVQSELSPPTVSSPAAWSSSLLASPDISRMLSRKNKHIWPPILQSIHTQRRWKKPPVDSAQTRLENRTLDLRLDKLTSNIKNLSLVLNLHRLISQQRNHYMSVQLLSKCRTEAGINTPIGAFLRKYPHVFELFSHPVRSHACCRSTQKMTNLIEEEARVVQECKPEAVHRLRKLLMMSKSGTLNAHALWLVRREMGLPDDFRSSVIAEHPDEFTLVLPDTVALVTKDGVDDLFEAEVEKWRERECREKWLSEFETKYAFPVQFPTGFKMEEGFRGRLKNWLRLPYVKPYERKEVVRARTRGGTERFEKRVVGILHEFLCLTVEKMVEVERLAHFRRDFNMDVNVRELLLMHPGIFYISTKGENQTVFLREAYFRGCLIEPNSIYGVRRKMLDLVLSGRRNTNQTQLCEEIDDICNDTNCSELVGGSYNGDSIVPLPQIYDEESTDVNMGWMCNNSDEEN